MELTLNAISITDKKQALHDYLEICKKTEVVMFLERIYHAFCEQLELEPIVDLSNPYVDSPHYQRLIISQTVALILSDTFEKSVGITEMLSEFLELLNDSENPQHYRDPEQLFDESLFSEIEDEDVIDAESIDDKDD